MNGGASSARHTRSLRSNRRPSAVSHALCQAAATSALRTITCSAEDRLEHIADEVVDRVRKRPTDVCDVAKRDDRPAPFVDAVRELGTALLGERRQRLDVEGCEAGGRR